MPTLVTKSRLQVSFDASEIPANLAGWSDSDFLKALRWKRGAPAALKDAAKAGNVGAFCRAWQALPAWKSAAGATAGLAAFWSRGEFPLEVDAIAGLERLAHVAPAAEGKRGAKAKAPAAVELEQWLARHGQFASPLELLFFFDWLPAHGGELPTELYWRTWRALTTAALEVAREFQGEPEASKSLVLDGELPWRMGVLWGDLLGTEALRKDGAEVLEEELTNDTDHLGTPRADLLSCLPLWLAPLVRSTRVAQATGVSLWEAGEFDHLRNVIERIAPLCLPRGTTALTGASIPADRTLFEAAFRTSEWSDAESAIRSLFPSAAVAKGKRRAALFQANGQTPASAAELCLAPSSQSDPARLACLRSNWSSHADLLVTGHLGSVPEICLAARGEEILAGKWQAEVRLGKKASAISGEWDSICWQSDEDGDYLELQTNLRGQCRVDRQMLLSRDGHFTVLADSVVGIAAGERIDYEMRLPLAPGVRADCDTATRECRLTAGEITARVFPLALPQDRAHGTPGELRVEGNTLVLRQAGAGRRLYVPLVIEWNPQRRELPAQWRTLTVSENRVVVAPDAASGHRLRIGPLQLLVYRSLLLSPEPRAVLGYHTRYETVVSAVDSEGDMQPILMVE